jgi:hypothetical protein
VADTFTGLDVGKAVTMKSGVLVAVSVVVVDGVGHAVITKRGVDVILAVSVTVPDAVTVAVAVTDAVTVEVELGGRAEGDTEAASAPTVRSTPQTSGSDRVAEYTQVGFSFTPLMDIVGPQARVRWKVREHVVLTGASGP